MIGSPGRRTQSGGGRPIVVGVSAAGAPARRRGIADMGCDQLRALAAGLCDRTVARHDGRVLGKKDDTRLATFTDARSGLAFAIDLQRAARGAHNPHPGGLTVRIGIAAGEATPSDNGAGGDAVVIAVAVTALAEAGTICLAREVLDALRPDLEVGCLFMTEVAVAGRSDAVRVYRVSLDPADAGRVVEGHVGLWDEQDG